MSTNATTQLDDLIANPNKHFSGPKEVLDRASLSRERKLAILRAMELDAKELSVATEENMPGPGDPGERLKAIADAIRAVEQDTPA